MAVQYTTTIPAVRELNLVGRANLDYWTAHLAGTGLTPLNVDGAAELSLGATDLTWMGVRFNESIAVLTLAQPGAPQVLAGGYLLHAFNSSRVLAFMASSSFATLDWSMAPPTIKSAKRQRLRPAVSSTLLTLAVLASPRKSVTNSRSV